MLRSRWILLLLALSIIMMTGSCGSQVTYGPPDLVPLTCHRELGVGMLFITVENRGHDAGPSTMEVVYKTHSYARPQVQLEVPTPEVPAGAERLVMVDLPSLGAAGGFLLPAGKITLTLDAQKVLPEGNRADSVLVTDCRDLTAGLLKVA